MIILQFRLWSHCLYVHRLLFLLLIIFGHLCCSQCEVIVMQAMYLSNCDLLLSFYVLTGRSLPPK
ncbi:hypothetical protein V8C40DRAFT_16955 [Trichoderma camerunense]